MKTIIIVFSGLLILGCSSQPYERKIIGFFEREVKVVPIIQEVKIDSTANMNSYHDHWNQQLKEERGRRRKHYADLLSNYQKLYDDSKISYKSLSSKGSYFADLANEAKQIMLKNERSVKEFQNKLDSVEVEINPYSKTFTELIDDNSVLNYLTVKYKLSEEGPIMIDDFVIKNDSLIYKSTSKNLDKWILEMQPAILLVKNGG